MTPWTAEQAREYRAARGAKTGQPGRPAFMPCGTKAAHKRHVRRGEPIDDACRLAYNAWARDMYRRRKGRAEG